MILTTYLLLVARLTMNRCRGLLLISLHVVILWRETNSTSNIYRYVHDSLIGSTKQYWTLKERNCVYMRIGIHTGWRKCHLTLDVDHVFSSVKGVLRHSVYAWACVHVHARLWSNWHVAICISFSVRLCTLRILFSCYILKQINLKYSTAYTHRYCLHFCHM